MEQTPILKRLYVGGLAHSISEAELQERFSKFGKVSEIEIVTRKDEQGIPTKTFAYINITLSEKELKRCLSILNKTKWKGGTLQIELAKESFLHRLARERQEASMKKEKPASNGIKNVIESLKESGIVDFHVKAVPGTEVPNHKDWVVGKFGRVLPIIHMKNRQKNKIIKYDPSKYCHNIKKLDQDITERVPISQLTWYLEEREDSMIKKWQGQFSASKSPKKKMKIQDSNGLCRTELNSYNQGSVKTQIVTPPGLAEIHIHNAKKPNQEQKLGIGLATLNNVNIETDSDSEEEIRALIARERKVQKSNSDNQHEDNVEVVGDNYELKYSTHWSLQKKHNEVVHTKCNKVQKTVENESDCDSVDTDEIIAVTKMPDKKKKSEIGKESKKADERRDGKSKKVIVTHISTPASSGSDQSVGNSQKGVKRATPEKASVSSAATQQDSIINTSNSMDSESSDSYQDTSQSNEDEEYKVLKDSSYRLDLTLEDLEKLVSKSTEVTNENSGNNWSDTGCKTNKYTSHIRKKRTVTTNSKKHICPEEIVAALLEESSDDDDDDDDIKRKNSDLKVQPFRGIGSLSKEVTKDEFNTPEIEVNEVSSDHISLDIFDTISKHSYSDSAHEILNSKSNSSKEMSADLGKETCLANSGANCQNSKASIEDNEVESPTVNILSERKCSRNLSISPKNSTFAHSKKEKQMEDNEKRLTALQERQKKREQQKQLIQGALTNLEHQSSGKQNHIIFDSDGEDEDEIQDGTKEGSPGKLQGKEFTTKIPGKLFESSEDESVTADDEADRFKIKPQFEGKAGEKLMHLQSRFGTDERFRMDARFLESDSDQEGEPEKVEMDEEEELVQEKKKNLEILKNILHIECPKPSKQTANAKKFKDMNALRYDPTKQDHAVFEIKPEITEKESKAKRKKKKEEAQKLPEVSKEIFFDVTVDLKEVLGSAKHEEKTKQMPWDKHSDDMDEATPDTEIMASGAGSTKQEETSGFTFSFFGAEEERSPMKEEPYVIETIKPLKVAWQDDPRFQDSSSEEDEAEVVEREDPTKISPTLPRSDVRFLFFSQDDERLKEGPKLFCRSSNLDEDREYWESRRQILLEDCRKKHKDARRKIKVKK